MILTLPMGCSSTCSHLREPLHSREGRWGLQGVPAESAALQAGHSNGVLVRSENWEALKPTRTGSVAQA